MSIGYSDWDITETSESGGSDKHNKGYFSTLQELNTAYPTAYPGDYAIVGTTDTVWVWDETTNAWVDTDTKGQVSSVNGKTGEVVLDAQDVGADYTQGTNVQISAERVISATDTTYTAGKNVTITGADNKINSDQYPLFTVNSGNLDENGEGDLLGEAVYTTTTKNNYTYVGDDYPANTTDGVITGGYNGTPVSPNASTFDFSTFFAATKWRLVVRTQKNRGFNIYICQGYANNAHIGLNIALRITFNSNAAVGAGFTGYYLYTTTGSSGSIIPFDVACPNYSSTYYYFSLMKDNDTVYIKYSADGETWTTMASFAYTSIVATNNIKRFYFTVGRDCWLDLNNTYVEINDEVVWRGYTAVNKVSSLPFKIGDTYPSIIATNGQGEQFTVASAEALDLSQATDGNYTVFVTPEGTVYANKGIVYVQKTQPIMSSGDVWLNTSVYPYKAVQSDGTTEFADVPFATFTIATQPIGSILVTNPQTLPYNRFQVTMAQVDAINTVLSGKQDSTTAVTHTASTAVGSATKGVYVASDGTATEMTYSVNKDVPSDAVFTDTTYSIMTGADGTTAGSSGLVPAPTATDNTKFLKGDGTWANAGFSTASLALPTGGEALADTTLYNYIKTLYDAGVSINDTNYTFAGSPTISTSGIVSGFTTTDYVVIPNFDYQSPFEIVFRFKTSNVSGEAVPILNYSKSTSTADEDRFGLAFTIKSSKLSLNTSSTGTSWESSDVLGTTTLQTNTWYWIKLVWSGTGYSVYSSLDNETYTLELSTNNSAMYSGLTYFKFGTNGMRNEAFTDGEIDLNSLTIKVNNILVFGGIYVPVKKLATGSKVADITNLVQIEEIYNLQGSALYYVIDTANETVRLPMGDIFGFITQALSL